MDPEKIGRLIAKSRKDKNMTQKDLASKLHITDKAISKWERGISLPDISLLIPISSILDISIYELLGGEMKSDEISKEDVNEVCNNIIKTSDAKNKKIKRLSKIIIAFLITVIILFGIYICLQIKSYKDYFGTSLDPTVVKIDDKDKYCLKIEDDNLVNWNAKCKEKKKIMNIYALLARLPLSHMLGNTVITGEDNGIIYSYTTTTDKMNFIARDKKYIEKAMIVTTTKSFIIIENLEFMNFEFKNKNYTVSKEDVTNFYKDKGLSLLDLTYDNIWEEQVIKKLENNTFLNEFPIKED